ncbi:replication protein P [Achromobacter spanius]|uniref:replication protein P n=1 Tax=Achromobacter spanius TaxID=217203 RepID=UPI003207B7F6
MTTVAQSTPERSAWAVPLAKLEGISLIDHLWNRLSGTYGGRWLKDFPDMLSIENWKTAWAEAFDEECLTPHEVAEGLRTCRRMSPDWPPQLGEFIRACRPALEPEVAFYTAVAGMAARHNGEQGVWPHPAIFWAAVETGAHDLQHCSYATLKARWERALNEVLARGEWKPVPAMVKALPAPPVTEASRAQAEEQMRKIGATGILNQSGRDPMRGWKRVIAETENPKGKRYSPGIVAMARNALRMDMGQGAQA